MNKNAKLATIFGIGALVAGLSYYFLVWRPQHPKGDKPKDDNTDEQDNWLTGGGSGNNSTGGSTNTSVIGKSIYANKDGVLVVDVNTGNVVRTKNKNEFIGTIFGEKTLSGKSFYTVAGGAWAVYKGFVKF